MINAVAAAGFNSIRIPVAWDSHANQRTFVIDPAWMARVKQVVDWCRAKNLTVIINCHWDGGWFDSNGFRRFDSKINSKVTSYWGQIATAFASYDSHLLFACANEPDIDSAAKTAVLEQYYQTFVNTVRAKGGNNATRWLVVQGPSTDIDKTYDWLNALPNDPTPGRLAVEVHYYPYQFCLMTTDATWGNMFYFWGQGYHSTTMPTRNSTWGEEDYQLAEFQKMQAKFTSLGIPVILGEFGAVRRTGYADLTGTELSRHLASRSYFYKMIDNDCVQCGMKPFVWDAGDTGTNTMWLFDRNTATVFDQPCITALTGGAALPPP